MESLQTFADSFPAALQWLAIMLVGAIPFVEGYGGSVLGVAIGVPVPIAILAAVVGNVLTVAATVSIASSIRERATARSAAQSEGTADGSTRDADEARTSGRGKQRIRRLFDRYGVPGVSLLGQWALPSQITAPTLVGFGASRGSVLVWQTIGIVLWGIVFGALAAAGFSLAMR